jgi:RNA polymerase sigma-70 factor, ECF subfamily
MPDRPLDDPTARAGRLYDLYGPSLYRYAVMLLASTADAEDAIQQVFAALLKGPAIENDAGYLRRAVRNECYSVLRRRRTRAVVALSDDVAESARLLESKGEETHPDERIALERALRALPAEQREVVHLHVYEGMTFQQVADTCDESINTVASRYRYALAKLRELLS